MIRYPNQIGLLVCLVHERLNGAPAHAAIDKHFQRHPRLRMLRGHSCEDAAQPTATGLGRRERIWGRIV
jgi:hypothetical protein